MTEQNTTFVLKLVANILVLRLIFCDRSSRRSLSSGQVGQDLRASVGQAGSTSIRRVGETVSTTVNSHILGQIHRDKDGIGSVQEGKSVGANHQNVRLGTDSTARVSVRVVDLSSHAEEGEVTWSRLLTVLSHTVLIHGYIPALSPTCPWTQAAKSLGWRDRKCLQSPLLPNDRPAYFHVTRWQFCLLAPDPKSEIAANVSVVLGLLLIGLFACVCLPAALCNTL